jgi:UrcA family protein
MKKIVSLALAAAVAVAAAAPASASSIEISDDGNYRVVVSYADLNLASEAGQRTLKGRVKAAAQTLCGEASMRLAERRSVDRCRTEVMDAARPQISLAARTPGSGALATAASR